MNTNTKKLKYALIGCGRIAPNHIAAAVANKDRLEIVAVCDVIPTHMDELLAKFDIDASKIKKYTDYKEMLEKEKPQLAAVATESGLHAKIALDVIKSGCSVIIEKPLAMSLDDADALIAAAKEHNVKLCACHQNRFNKSVEKIRTAMEDGRFGKLLHGAAHIRWNRGEDYYKQAPWRGKWASDGGALMNQCIHNIDLLRWMMGGEPVEVMAYTDNLNHPYIEAEDLGLAIIKFNNGSYGLVEGTTNIFPKNLEETLYIFGEKGTVKAGGKSDNLIEEWNFADNAPDEHDSVIREFSENPPNIYGFGHTPLYTDMISAVIDDRAPYVPGEAGRAALELVLAIYKSAATNAPVKLPLEHCASTDFEGRFDTAVR